MASVILNRCVMVQDVYSDTHAMFTRINKYDVINEQYRSYIDIDMNEIFA